MESVAIYQWKLFILGFRGCEAGSKYKRAAKDEEQSVTVFIDENYQGMQ
jgi:hypothetical protein